MGRNDDGRSKEGHPFIRVRSRSRDATVWYRVEEKVLFEEPSDVICKEVNEWGISQVLGTESERLLCQDRLQRSSLEEETIHCKKSGMERTDVGNCDAWRGRTLG